jgi:quinol monooxygenase YgiN
MQYVLIIHEVADYPAWKKVFDAAAGIRKDAGERSYQVLKYETDANRIVHFSAWTSIADAKAFFESPRLVQIRREAGVKAPEFIYLEQLEAGTLWRTPARAFRSGSPALDSRLIWNLRFD